MGLTASCHCGAVTIELAEAPDSLTECNCSVCYRYGALWAYGTRQTITVKAHADKLRYYCWGDKCIEFYHCQRCGCLTHYESVEKSRDSRVAVNARMLPPDHIQALKIRRFDGADSWQFLD
jgi:hypothetical protein